MPSDRDDEAPDGQVDDASGSEPVDMDALVELSRKVKEGLRGLIPDWRSRGLIDEEWLEAYEASLDDPMRPPPPPPRLGRDEGGDLA